MIPVLDVSGVKIEGLYKRSDGSLSVINEHALNKYKREQHLEQRVSNIESKLDTLIHLLQEKING
jgi:hypothetical protein